MKKIFFAIVALAVLIISCKAQDRQQGNAERLDIFHRQKQVK